MSKVAGKLGIKEFFSLEEIKNATLIGQYIHHQYKRDFLTAINESNVFTIFCDSGLV